MPILDIGYRNWRGPRTPAWTRAWVVASTGVKLAWGSTWIKRILILLTFPSLIVATMVGAFEQSMVKDQSQEALSVLQGSQEARKILSQAGIEIQQMRQDPQVARHFVWSYLLFSLFRYPQAFGMILIVGLVGPRLISYDLRSRGYLLYLSRPLTPGEYVLGKAGVLYTLLFWVATVPALSIYMVGLFLSTDTWAILHTWDIPLRILIASLFLILPTSAIALAISSLTQESRYAGFAWFAVWLIGHVTYTVLWSAEQFRESSGRRISIADPFSPLMLLSPYELLGYLQKKSFGLVSQDAPWLVPLIAVAFITIAGYGIAYWRVSRMLKQ